MGTQTTNPLVKLRHELHQNPDLSGSEKGTRSIIRDFVKSYLPDRIIEPLGQTGIAFIYEGKSPGPTVMIRCELDALPIEENNDISYRSSKKNVSHKCGHDGHMTIVAGLAKWLHSTNLQSGRVVLLFQPAEENGKGAKQVIEDPKFNEIIPDHVFALHNIPGVPMHEIIVVDNQFSMIVQSAGIVLRGMPSHASEPEKGKNPSSTIASLIHYFESECITGEGSADFTLITPVYISCGSMDYGISPGHGEIHLTCRTCLQSQMEKLVESIETKVNQLSFENELIARIDWFDYFPASINDTHGNDVVRKSALKNKLSTTERALPYRFGEDFGWYSRKFSSTLFGLGSGIHTPNLHNPAFDFPDKIIDTGVKMFQGIIEEVTR